MRPHQLRRRLAFAALGAILAGAALGTGIAKADPDRVSQYTIAHSTDICSTIDKNPTDDGLVAVTKAVISDGFTVDEAVHVVLNSIAVWCPENQTIVDHLTGNYTPILTTEKA